ncbi:protein FAM111A-like [Neolamprologus brichardi]|uniref:protein FAM111A-like n=1 Tax=Neolamprologus brichardi TaxID=32507 RepID=UPI001643C831|nr:protein FAM111A-like [Neolamprologus brichardi]
MISLNVILMMLLYMVYKSGEDRAPTTVSNNTDQALEEDSSQEQQALQEQDSAGGSSRVKTEPEEVTASQDPHEHGFAVKFKSGDTYDIDCEQPCTVLEALKTLNKYKKMFTDRQQNVIIQRGTGDDESIVPTHFPCSCIRDGEVLTISVTKLQVEKATDVRNVHPTDYYSVFYIDTKGGLNVTSTKLFRNTKVENFKYLCVYGEKEMSVEEALKRDGRFIDELGCFELMNINDEHMIVCTQKIKKLHNKKFKICCPRKVNTKTNQQAMPGQQKQQVLPHASTNAERTKETGSVLAVAHQKGISLKTAEKETSSDVDINTIYKQLREQFPNLKQVMERRFPGETFQEELNLRKENFGKIQQSFSQVYRVRKLLELGKSVCNFIIQGTGFVLFDNFVLTNAHLFKYWIDSKLPDWHKTLNVTAVFNFETQEFKEINKINAKVFVGDAELDYVILELITESQVPPGLLKRFGPVPPGLLKRFGPVPLDGAACVVGHPGGGVKKMDPTCVIEKTRREEAVHKNLEDYKEYIITLYAINQAIKNDPYENTYVTYNSFMYHRSSGYPVFDAHGRVFGLHSGGFFYGFPKSKQSVIEFSFPLLTIFENFVGNWKKEGTYGKVLARVEEEAKGNPHLEYRFKSVVGPKQGSPEGHLQEVQGNTAASEEPMQITASESPATVKGLMTV